MIAKDITIHPKTKDVKNLTEDTDIIALKE